MITQRDRQLLALILAGFSHRTIESVPAWQAAVIRLLEAE